MNKEWKELIDIAEKKLSISKDDEFISYGGVAAAIKTDKGNIYQGICIDTSCSLGLCAERSAIVYMICEGKTEIKKVVCLGEDKKPMLPCGACMEFMMQLSKNSPEIEIIVDTDNFKTVKLKELIPKWWGEKYYK